MNFKARLDWSFTVQKRSKAFQASSSKPEFTFELKDRHPPDKEHAMSNASGEMHKTRIISELKGFIRKLLQDPKILEQSLVVARARLKEGAEQGKNEQAVLAIIANEISDTTSIHIPEDPAEHSDADKLFLELLKDVVEEEEALY